MKLVKLSQDGYVIPFLVAEDVATYIAEMDDNFLDDPEEREFFAMLFPDHYVYVRNQVQQQIDWQTNKDLKY